MTDHPRQHPDENNKSLGDQATSADASHVVRKESLGEQSTSGDADSSKPEPSILDKNIPVVDLTERYDIQDAMGKGGMGEVLRAIDTRLKRPVAIKRVLGEMTGSKKALSRFLIEARSIAALNHFNIVQIYDYGRDARGPFIIMELVEGQSLQEKLKTGKLEIKQTIDIACQLCDGLSVAHEQGIIHRDIKPANVLLTERGDPKLSDFGLARHATVDDGQTQVGAVLGTIDFMAPEQQREATAADARSDIWSLAATVYQMVTGKSPIVIRLDLVPDILKKILTRALQDDPAARYQTALEFKNALCLATVNQLPTETFSSGSGALSGEGYCISCKTKNDPSRTFCRSCGSSLYEQCLSCNEEKPLWEQICGKCGGNQANLFNVKREEITHLQAEITSLREEHLYEEALAKLQAFSYIDHPQFTVENEWAKEAETLIQTQHRNQIHECNKLISKAKEEKQKGRFIEAIAVLEKIPAVMRKQESEVLILLDQCKSDHRERKRLLSEIEQQIASKELAGLLEKLNRFLVLSPGNSQFEPLQRQLQKRRDKAETRAAELMEQAEQQYLQGQNAKLLETLKDWPTEVSQSDRFWFLKDQAQTRIERLQQLNYLPKLLQEKEADLSMLPLIEEYLRLQPENKELQEVSHRLVQQELAEISFQQETKKAAQRQAILLKRIAVAGVVVILLAGFVGAILSTRATLRNRGIRQLVTAGTKHLESNQFVEAIVEYNQALKRDEDNVEALVGRAWCWMSQQSPELDKVFRDLRKAETIDPDNERLNAVRARAYAQQVVLLAQAGNIREAVTARKNATWNSRYIPVSAQSKVIAEELEIATESLMTAYLKQASTNAKAAKIDQTLADLQEAEQLGAQPVKITAIQKQLAPAYLVRAKAAIESQQIDTAFTDLDQAELLNGTPELLQNLRAQALLVRSDILRESENFIDALATIDEAVKLNSNIAVKSRQAELHVLAAKKDLLEKKDLLSIRRHFAAARTLDNQVAGLGNLAAALSEVILKEFDEDPTAENYEAVIAVLGALGLDNKHADELAEVQRQFTTIRGKSILEFEENPTDANQAKAILVLQAIEADEKQSATLDQLKDRLVNGLVKRVTRSINASELEAAILDLEIAKFFGGQSATIDRATAEVTTVLAKRCQKLLRDGEIIAAAEDYETLDSLDTTAANQLLPLFSKLPSDVRAQIPVAVLKRLPAKLFLNLPPEKNSIGMTFRLLPPGVFVMGSPASEVSRGEYEDEHRVTLTRPFFLGIHEVTQQQYQQVMMNNPSTFPGAERPVETISWQEASLFCQKLSALPAEKKAGRVYRLPTEAEWEYACRAGTRSAYSFGDNPKELGIYAWTASNSMNETHPVGKKKPNNWGLYDMHGNVYEWCADWQGAFPMGATTDPRGDSGERLALRGGSFKNPAKFARSAAMHTNQPETKSFTHGFRILREYHSRADEPDTAISQKTDPTVNAALSKIKIVNPNGTSILDLKLRYQPITTAIGTLIGVSVEYRFKRPDRLPPGQYGLVLEAANGRRIGSPVDLQDQGTLTLKRVTEFAPNSGPFKVFLVKMVEGRLHRISSRVTFKPTQ